MTQQSFCLFSTAIGHCGLAWTAHGISRLVLPAADDADTEAALRRGVEAEPGVPTGEAASAIEGVTGLLEGDRIDLTGIRLDLAGVPQFHRAVYDQTRGIPPGRFATYGEIATRLGQPGAARAVGQALGLNPVAIIIPCHRVLAAGNKYGGFSAPGGVDTKLTILRIEGAIPQVQPTLFD